MRIGSGYGLSVVLKKELSIGLWCRVRYRFMDRKSNVFSVVSRIGLSKGFVVKGQNSE